MCTAISFKQKDHYFGRNLDLEGSFGETVTVTPRNFPLAFRKMGMLETHYAMIGMAHIAEGYPLYYDATNEKGLSMAGLNFPGNAVYHPLDPDKYNPAPFELIPWLLGQCDSVSQAEKWLEKDCICPPKTPVCICDKRATIKIINNAKAKPSFILELLFISSPQYEKIT